MASNSTIYRRCEEQTIKRLSGCSVAQDDEEIQTYVFEHLMPVKVEDSNNKHWYWMKYIAEEIDFWTCNDAYKELYDRQAFQETIDRVLAEIADTLGVLMKA